MSWPQACRTRNSPDQYARLISDYLPWSISGTYLEACSCVPICPHRRIDGRLGGRPTYGVCKGAISWQIERGHAGDVQLSGLRVALAHTHDADEPGSPWSFLLFLHDGGDERQREALEQIFLGRLGGIPQKQFPWVARSSNPLAVRTVKIEIDHERGDGWFRAGRYVFVSISGPVVEEVNVTSDIAGLDQRGRELHSEQVKVDDEELNFEVRDRCGFESDFEYWSAGA